MYKIALNKHKYWEGKVPYVTPEDVEGVDPALCSLNKSYIYTHCSPIDSSRNPEQKAPTKTLYNSPFLLLHVTLCFIPPKKGEGNPTPNPSIHLPAEERMH